MVAEKVVEEEVNNLTGRADMGEQTTKREGLSVKPIGVEPLIGRRVLLESTGIHHASFLERCLHDTDFMELYRLNQNRDLNRKQIEEWIYSERRHLPQQLGKIEWVIHRLRDKKKSFEPIGLASLVNYVSTHNRAELLLGILDQKHRRTGISIEASYLILDFAFNKIKLNKVLTFVYSHNVHAQKTVCHLGFKQEGYLHKHIWNPYKKEFVDTYQNGLLVDDFRSNHQISRLTKRLIGRDITLPLPTLKCKKLSGAELERIKQNLVTSHTNG